MHHHALAAGAAPPAAASAPSGAEAAEAAAAAAEAAAVATVATVGAAVGGVGTGAAADGLDAFVQLGVLIVEGRVAGSAGARGPRGYGEGPHCASPGAAAGSLQTRAHQCDPANFLCSRARRLRAHLRLLWQTRLPLCVEVLAAPECACAAARAHAVDVGAPPPPPPAAAADLLLERWHVAVASPALGQPRESTLPAAPGGEMSVRSLLSAVRSQLHFSQLAAWLSASGGARPRHVCYRLALPALSEAPGAFAASRFSRPPLDHAFPPAPLAPGGPFLQVSVKMLPRMDTLPILQCPLHASGSAAELTPTIPGKQMFADIPPANVCGNNLGAMARTSAPLVETCASEPLLGDSLLDPPPSMQLLRGRSSRISSPPPAILQRAIGTGRTTARWRDTSPPSPPSSSLPQRRRGRQGMARRRDTSSGGSIPVRNQKTAGTGSNSGDLLDDRMQNPCTRPGKHHCRCAYEDDAADCGSSPFSETAGPSVSTSMTPSSNIRSTETPTNTDSISTVHTPKPSVANVGSPSRKLSLELSQSEVEEVLAVLRDRNPSTRPSNHINKNTLPSCASREPEAHSRGCKNQLMPSTPLPQELATEVYLSKPSTSTSRTAHKADLLLDAILRARCPAKKLSPNFEGCDPDERVTKDRTKVSSYDYEKKFDYENWLETPKKTSSSSVPLLNRRLGQLRGAHSPPLQLQTLQIPEPLGTRTPSNNAELTSIAAVQTVAVPSAQETALFRRSLRSAACMVFHCRTGLPLTSSPAPVRRRHDSARFDFDSSLNSVSAIRSALFEATGSLKNSGTLAFNGASSPSEDSETSVGSPGSPGISPQALTSPMKTVPGPMPWPPRCHISHCSSLLGSFEESVLNGRLEPVSTVQGFTADLGASGAFCPRHLLLPVTVFFYTLGDNDKVSTPYLGHINLGKKGYTVPRAGTIQVTLLNPLGTVVKMFVVQYDLSDMPPQSTTFLRQRTLYLPAGGTENCRAEALVNCQALQKHLRYLIHLRFSSSRSGRISLHTDIRMIIFRKSDLDTATAHGGELAYELRSFTHGPTNPKFSPRK